MQMSADSTDRIGRAALMSEFSVPPEDLSPDWSRGLIFNYTQLLNDTKNLSIKNYTYTYLVKNALINSQFGKQCNKCIVNILAKKLNASNFILTFESYMYMIT